MTSIFCLIETMLRNQFRCNYLKNKKTFLNFSFQFLNLAEIFIIFQNKEDPHSWCISSNTNSVKQIRSMSNKSRFKGPSKSIMWNRPEHCWNLNNNTFTIFIDHCEGNWVLKTVCKRYAKLYDCLLTHWMQMTSILFLTETI